MRTSVDLPEAVTLRARSHGDAGARWLRALPSVIDEIERRWNITIGDALDGGSAGFVAFATLADGDSAVVKVAFPDELDDGAFSQSTRVYGLAAGRGCATLLAHDAELSAILLERLGRRLSSLGLPAERQVEIICATVRQVWVPVPDGTPLPTGATKAAWLADFIATTWEELDRPCSTRGLNTDLLTGDAHRLGRERARFIAQLTGVDETAIWQWGFVERVSSGLHIMSLGLADGDEFLAVADRWAEPD